MRHVRYAIFARPHHFLWGVVVAAALFPAFDIVWLALGCLLFGYVLGLFALGWAVRNEVAELEGQVRRLLAVNKRMCRRARDRR